MITARVYLMSSRNPRLSQRLGRRMVIATFGCQDSRGRQLEPLIAERDASLKSRLITLLVYAHFFHIKFLRLGRPYVGVNMAKVPKVPYGIRVFSEIMHLNLEL